MSVEVITVYNQIPQHPYLMLDQFHKSLELQGAKATILGYGEEWHGLMTKPLRMRQYLESGKCKADVIIQADAYDVLWRKSPEEITERYKDFDCEMVIGAERNCFPEAGMACDFPHTESQFKYLNSGFIVTTPAAMLRMLWSMDIESIGFDRQGESGRIEPNDQYWIQREFFKDNGITKKLDTNARLCLNLCGVENWQDYDPCCFHFNGPKERLDRDKIFEACGL